MQYQKQLRLQAARAGRLIDGLDTATAAFEVGYESASQFNREYSRFFGHPPCAISGPSARPAPRGWNPSLISKCSSGIGLCRSRLED